MSTELKWEMMNQTQSMSRNWGWGVIKYSIPQMSDCEGLGVRLVDGIIVIIYHTCMTGF